MELIDFAQDRLKRHGHTTLSLKNLRWENFSRNFLFDFKHGDNSTPIWLACDIVKQDFHPDRAQRSDIRTSSAEIVRYSATFATPRPAQPLGDWIPLLTGPTSFLSRRYRQQRDPTQHRPEPPTRQMSFRQQ